MIQAYSVPPLPQLTTLEELKIAYIVPGWCVFTSCHWKWKWLHVLARGPKARSLTAQLPLVLTHSED